jgi:hypothetical protein
MLFRRLGLLCLHPTCVHKTHQFPWSLVGGVLDIDMQLPLTKYYSVIYDLSPHMGILDC